jgi:hypothetical protein
VYDLKGVQGLYGGMLIPGGGWRGGRGISMTILDSWRY